MLKTYREEYRVLTRDCDMSGTLRPGALLEYMQETSGTHSELLGVGRKALSQQGIAWVVTRMEVQLNRTIRVEENISVETYPLPIRRWFFPRYFFFRDEQEQVIGEAASLWVLLDLTTRRMARPELVERLLPDNSDLPAPLGLPAPVTEISGTVEVSEFEPVYTDLDPNWHVNNCRYLDWCCNALGVDLMNQYELGHFMVNYDQEIRPGQSVRTELRRLGMDFSFTGFSGGQRHFDVGGQLRERKKA
ncbi:MAG: hypothetical protein IKP40_07580 [Clostridia bacterium]|nr:hypothetical protein [Clostridia bacterium]